MGSMVEKALASSVQALKERDLELALAIVIADFISLRAAVRLFRGESIVVQWR
jgi:uncharacterized protein with von Willebrand factor type A (vWA) domain